MSTLADLKQQLNAPLDLSSYKNNLAKHTSQLYNVDSANNSGTSLSSRKSSIFDTSIEDAFKITSNYWKLDSSLVNDELDTITSFSLHESKPLIAIGSTGEESNLMICNLDINKNLLSHTQSISLPSIYSMKWLYDINKNTSNSSINQEDNFSFLLTGHSKGYVHLTLIPDLLGDNDEDDEIRGNAEIIKRFNHSKHVQNDLDLTYKNPFSTTINCLNITPESWRSANKNSLITCYQENIFLWDSSRSSIPILKSKAKGVNYFDPCPERDGLLALSGEFGICLFDMRAGNSKIGKSTNGGSLTSSYYLPHKENNKKTNICKWSPFNSNLLASSETNGVVKLWDVRKGEPVAVLNGHYDSISSMQWSNLNKGDLYTGSQDGNIIHWNFTNSDNTSIFGNGKLDDNSEEKEDHEPVQFQECTVKKESRGFELRSKKSQVKLSKEQIKFTRECGTLIPASNSGIVDLIPIKARLDGSSNVSANGGSGSTGDIISVDHSLFLGIHGMQDRTQQMKVNKKREAKPQNRPAIKPELDEEFHFANAETSTKSLSINFTSLDPVLSKKPPAIKVPETPFLGLRSSEKSPISETSQSLLSLIEDEFNFSPSSSVTVAPTIPPSLKSSSRKSSDETLYESYTKDKPSQNRSLYPSPISPDSTKEDKLNKIMSLRINSSSTLVDSEADGLYYHNSSKYGTATAKYNSNGITKTHSKALGDFQMIQQEIDEMLSHLQVTYINNTAYI